MSAAAILFFLVCAIAILAVPRRLAPVPMLAGCCYMTMGQGIDIGPATLPIYRMLLLVGMIRVVSRGERIVGGLNLIDKLLIGWGIWGIFASFFHEYKDGSGPVFACGKVFSIAGAYFLWRTWLQDVDAIKGVIVAVAILLAPVSVEMALEKVTGKNMFSVFGGVREDVLVRKGKLRAQGPFKHPILAGTVGATCIPLFAAIWREKRKVATIGIGAGVLMTLASASSGPMLSLIGGVGALLLWKIRMLTPLIRGSAIGIYLLLMLVMSRPPYYLIAELDVTGGSTGWHRALLIDKTFRHFNEWFMFGTDRTRHWMPGQGAISPTHTDITNYYISFGVFGGILSMLLIISILIVAFSWVGKLRLANEHSNPDWAFFIWCCGCSLVAHAATSISVAYFDQSLMFFWLAVGIISSMWSCSDELEDESDDSVGGLDVNPA